jgi:hypothetical protein
MEGMKTAEVNTEHAEGAGSSIQYRFRSFFHRNLPNNSTITIGDTTDRAGHAADGTINTPNRIDHMDIAGLSQYSRNGTDILAESATGAGIHN